MTIVVYGASGRAGSRIVNELLSRGHQVIASVRDSAKSPSLDGVETRQDDLADPKRTAEVITGADAVVSAYAPPPNEVDALIGVTQRFVEAFRQNGSTRFLMVGGAGVLEVAPGVTLIDSGYLPPEWMSIAKAHAHALKVLQQSDIDWTYISPAAYFDPGTRTGHYRAGTTNLIADEKGESRISMEDYAIAVADELESAKHRRQQMSVGY
jgi:putative NADH-flavin reductase